MQKSLISDGITSIMRFCNENRTAETVCKYRLACEKVSIFYADNDMGCYDQSFNEELRLTVQENLEKQASTRFKFKEDRYLFRTLKMLDDFFSGQESYEASQNIS